MGFDQLAEPPLAASAEELITGQGVAPAVGQKWEQPWARPVEAETDAARAAALAGSSMCDRDEVMAPRSPREPALAEFHPDPTGQVVLDRLTLDHRRACGHAPCRTRRP